MSDENKKQLLIPKGFAHGFLVLSEQAILSYKVDNFYDKKLDRGIIFDDKELAIDWGINKSKLLLSSKDMKLPLFRDIQVFEH